MAKAYVFVPETKIRMRRNTRLFFMEITENINNWLKNGERGISSEAIVSHLTGINIVKRLGSTDYPKDPG